MSGFEIVGAVLGGLPLIISAIEHFDDVVQPFHRYRNFVPALELFRLRLRMARTTFRNDCCILLESLTDRSTARRALDRSLKPDVALSKKFAGRMGESLEVCDEAVRVICEKVMAIEGEGRKFDANMNGKPIDPVAQIEWCKQVAKKLKFAFSKVHLDRLLEDLSTWTNEFATLCTQIRRLEAPEKAELTTIKAPKACKKILDCQRVQKASRQLYSALCNSCSMHNVHSAHFKLEPRHVEITENGESTVRFNIAFTMPSNPGEQTLYHPAWLTVESVDCVRAERTEAETSTAPIALTGPPNSSLSPILTEGRLEGRLSGTLKRALESPSRTLPKRTKVVSFAASVHQQTASISTRAPIASLFELDPDLPDFCVRQNFCVCMQLLSQSTMENPDRHIGYLQKTGPCKNLVYFSLPEQRYQLPSDSMSLSTLVRLWAADRETDASMPLQRIRLAKQLASAVLQFHETPLLKRSWQSQDILFFGKNSTSRRMMIRSPHLNVLVEAKMPLVENTASTAPNVAELLIRNQYLFNLAIVLLEIAYQKPFDVLIEESIVGKHLQGAVRDVIVARTLSEDVSARLGPIYGEVVRKCLECDFNIGTADLKNPALQAMVYQDVVVKLENLEMDISKQMLTSTLATT